MGLVRTLLAAIALGTGLVFLASVFVIRPAGERDDPVAPDALAGLADRTPAPLGDEPLQSERARQAAPLAAGTLRHLELEVRDASSGAALGDVEVDLFHQEADGRERRTPHRIETAGAFRLGPLPAVPLEFLVRKRGWFPSPRMAVPARDGGEPLVVELAPAALIEGTARALDGDPARAGVVRFEDLVRGTVHAVRVQRGGRVVSPPLEDGTWRIEWREHVQAAAPATLRMDLPLAAGTRLRVRLTLPLDGAGAPAGVLPGIEILP